MIKWLRVKFLNWLLQGVTSLSIGEETTSVSAAGVTFGDATVIATGSASQAQPANTKDTIYQNGTKLRLVSIIVSVNTGEEAVAEVGAATPPTTLVGGVDQTGATGVKSTITFLVLPSYYYRLREVSATITISEWTEWDLL